MEEIRGGGELHENIYIIFESFPYHINNTWTHQNPPEPLSSI